MITDKDHAGSAKYTMLSTALWEYLEFWAEGTPSEDIEQAHDELMSEINSHTFGYDYDQTDKWR